MNKNYSFSPIDFSQEYVEGINTDLTNNNSLGNWIQYLGINNFPNIYQQWLKNFQKSSENNNFIFPNLSQKDPTILQKYITAYKQNGNQVPDNWKGTQIPADQQLTEQTNDDYWGKALGGLFSQGASSATRTLTNNFLKGEMLTKGLGQNVATSIGGTAAGMVGQGVGSLINHIGGDSKLSRGIGQSIGTGIGMVGGQMVSNVMKGANLLSGFRPVTDALNASKTAFSSALSAGSSIKEASEAAGAAGNAAKIASMSNLIGLGGSVVGAGLQAALGPSKEYNGRYGNITRTMDTVYDLTSAAAGFVPGAGTIMSGAMALNKGLSNIFGSTDGMTKTDAILGSAFMPAPIKWINMWGSSTTGDLYNQSWQNTEKTNSFMGNAFGDLADRIDRAREEAGKTYGTFSHGAYKRAQKNIDFVNPAYSKLLSMADQNILQNIRSVDMSSINNQRYAQRIQGGWTPLVVGKLGMKILNNATNHNIGMRLLSGAALIDNKQMILCSAVD